MESEEALKQKIEANQATKTEQGEEEPDWTFSYLEKDAGITKETIERAQESKEGGEKLASETEAAAQHKVETVKDQSEAITQEAAGADLSQEQTAEIAGEAAAIAAEAGEAKATLDSEVAAAQSESGEASADASKQKSLETMSDEEFEAAAKEVDELKEKNDRVYARIQELGAKRKELAGPIEAEMIKLLGEGVVNNTEGLKGDEFKGADKVQEIMDEVDKAGDNKLQVMVEKMNELQVPLMLRMGTLGKIKKLFTENPAVAEMLKVDQEETPLWEQWHSMNKELDEKKYWSIQNEKQRRERSKAA